MHILMKNKIAKTNFRCDWKTAEKSLSIAEDVSTSEPIASFRKTNGKQWSKDRKRESKEKCEKKV